MTLGSVTIGLALTARLTIGATPVATSNDPFDAGPLSDFGEGIADTFAFNAPNLFVVRTKDRLFVSSSFCTHKRCVVERTGAGYSCTCHRCRYTPEGVPLRGPATRALPRYRVWIDARQHVMVDLSKVFEQDAWEADGAFVKVIGNDKVKG